MKKKIAVAAAAFALVLCFAVGGTLAWLTARTNTITNTFTKGDVKISLTETWNTDTDGNGSNDAWQAQLIPGKTYDKNPTVAVLDGTNVDCWLFVKFEELNGAADYLNYTSTLTTDNGWTQGEGTDGIPKNVWYRMVEADDLVKQWRLLAGNEVTVKGSVTEDNMDAAADAKLVYTAYAAQKDNLTAAEAWALFAVA